MKIVNFYFLILTLFISSLTNFSFGQCNSINDEETNSFQFDDHSYLIVKSNLSYEQVAKCALNRGGYLAQINSDNEGLFILNQAINFAEVFGGDFDEGLAVNQIFVWLGKPSKTQVKTTPLFSAEQHLGIDQFKNNDKNNGVDYTAIIPRFTLSKWENEAPFSWLYDVQQSPSGTHSKLFNFFIIEFDNNDGLVNYDHAQFLIYPSSTSSFVNIQSNININVVEIISADGKVVKSLSVSEQFFDSQNDFAIDLSDLNNGLFFIRLVYGDQLSFTQKIVKQ